MSLAPPTFFTNVPKPSEAEEDEVESWRAKDRKMKTLNVGLVVCLNIGVTPPDVIKPTPCAKKECWMDPASMPPLKATQAIGSRLAEQYLRWQPKAKCKQALDPNPDDVKRLCSSLHRRAKDEPIIFHYNGHGVPKPTTNGEIWVFNNTYTQYLPISLYDLQLWIKGPAFYVFDCAGAEVIVEAPKRLLQQLRADMERKLAAGRQAEPVVDPFADCILLGACRADEQLPTNPSLPADLFTACLTTPVETALLWVFVTRRNALLPRVTLEMLEQVPGLSSDRRTMRGQLHWLLTAVTDSIAWSTLPTPLFLRLFRNDLLMAALMRNFLLADRIMRSANCTPVSSLNFPPTHDHPLWKAWDVAVDHCLAQLPAILEGKAEFEPSLFFSDQLTAFEVWLNMHPHDPLPPDATSPEQLPVVLQVLLSQQHRLRALELLGRFVSSSANAVRRALSVGIFPYVFKLLGSPAGELRPVLVSIWAKILSVDAECKRDLMKPLAVAIIKPNSPPPEKGFMYFLKTLLNPRTDPDTRAKAAFVLAVFCNENQKGQELCLGAGLVAGCLPMLTSDHAPLRQWAALAIAKACLNLDAGREMALSLSAPAALVALLTDPVQEVRAAAVCALTSLVGLQGSTTDSPSDLHINIEQIALPLLRTVDDGSHTVRAELVAALSPVAVLYQDAVMDAGARLRTNNSGSDSFCRVLKALYALSSDPYPVVSAAALALLEVVGIKPNRRPEAGGSGAVPVPVPVPVLTPTLRRSSAVPTMAKAPVRMDLPPESVTAWSLDGTSASQWLMVQQAPARARDEPLEPTEAESLVQQLIAHVNELADVLEQAEESSSPELRTRDIQMSLRARIEPVLNLCPEALPVLESLGWKGTEFAGSLNFSRLQHLAEALRPFAPKSKYGRELHVVQTGFFAWCCHAFCGWSAAAGNTIAKAEEREWCQERNAAVWAELADLEDKGKHLRLDQSVFQASIDEVADVFAFHSYEPHLVMTNAQTGNINVWNTEKITEICTFPSGTRGARVTSLKLINEHEEAMLAVGSSDGVVRLWQDYSTTPTLLTSWRAVSKVREPKDGVGAGLVCDWDQRTGRLFASGDTSYIQVWDAATALRCSRIATGVASCVTAVSVDKSQGSLFAVGFGNGSVRLHDVRMAAEQSLVQQFDHHTSWVVNVHINPDGMHGLVSGSRVGDLLWWDQRFPGQPIRSVMAYSFKKDDLMTSFVVHDHASLMATAAPNHPIKIFNREGDLLNQHKHYTTFLGEAIGPTSSLAFHPLRPMLAAGSFEKLVTIFAPTK